MVTKKELTEFAQIIYECRGFTDKIKVTDEKSMKYLFLILYSKSLLSICEIYTLLIAGYPEGAMALARNTYETIVIMTYLYDHRNDQELINRFYDDYSVKICQDDIEYFEWIIANGKGSEYTYRMLKERKDEYMTLLKRYSTYASKKKDTTYFKQYWWAGGMSFNQLRIRANYSHNYLYNLSCYRVHAGMTGMETFDNIEEGLLIGSCEGGKEDPFFFALLNFSIATKFFCNIQSIDCSAVFARMENLIRIINI